MQSNSAPQNTSIKKKNKYEVISKGQIMLEGKAGFDSKAERTRQYVSILDRIATQHSSIRWAFEITSRY